jgi:aldose 1-epimerase
LVIVQREQSLMIDHPLIVLTSGPLRASICPALGAGLADLSLRGPTGFFYPLMRRAAPGEANASLLASFFMAPWVNRVRGGTFAFAGRTITLRTNTADGMAQHGDVRRRVWRTLSADATTARLEFNSADVPDSNWPWRYRVTAEYALSPEALTIDLTVHNDDREAFPAGCGHHPYFSRRLWNDRDEVQLRVPVAARYPLEQGCAVGALEDDELSHALRTLAVIPSRHIDGCFAAAPAASDALGVELAEFGCFLAEGEFEEFVEQGIHLLERLDHLAAEDGGSPQALNFIAIWNPSRMRQAGCAQVVRVSGAWVHDSSGFFASAREEMLPLVPADPRVPNS